jgi:chromosome partitioning protein
VLRERLAAVPADRGDYIIIDCPPGWGRLTVCALTAAHEIIIPVEAHVLGLTSLPRLFELVELVKKQHNAGLRIAGVLACRVDARCLHSIETVELLRAHVGPLAFETVIREHASLAESPSSNQSIFDYDERSTGTEDFRALIAELLVKSGNTSAAELVFQLTQCQA